MQHHLPVVSTTEGAIRDMVKDGVNGLICEHNNAVSLANALSKLITQPLLRKTMGKKGNELYKKHFALDAFEERMRKILLESCAS